MTLGKRHWTIALSLALMLHLSLLVVVLAGDREDGAKDEGEQGIEIDLGMLGDLGEASETLEEATVEPAAEPEPEKVVEAPDPEPVEQPEPVVEEPPAPPAIQKPVVKAKEPIAKPKPKPVVTDTKPTEKPVPVETRDAPAEKADTTREAQQKMSTGRANALTQGGSPAARQSWFAKVAAELARHKRYPIAARRRGQEGVAKISFLVNRKGEVLEYKISESSGYKKLDDAVIDMLLKAKPLPEFPSEMTQEEIRITLPVEFALES
ncbi:Ferric siderophore transport system, periplasmic binding protein TonB [Marinobacterium lacunae]|uniref:Ferric siderophore transport system, periplasmic binding protein TonB n=1 Tax=Marinobacterium lacunae TaxID=1232683 RepID=A0A081FYV3_9GAMM|nr:energy transducer TonB [Marinobacterium lacunae]KEA63708.1 Ferric siderophore transport system, periplasmic binding protein TonB [Marinobacterium lacunae]MBR9883387.1 energy transducer TonB [Oceanospirillales bacterium]